MALKLFRLPVGSRKCVQGHTVLITDRGGKVRVMEVKDIAEVKWGRVTSSRSSASITITGSACRRQAKRLAQVEPRRHEVVIYRGSDRVWEGPIRYIKTTRNTITITAYDVLDYPQGRALTKYWPGPEDGGPSQMTKRVEDILRYELATAYTAPGTTDVIPAWEGIAPPIGVLAHLDIRHGPLLTTADTLPFGMTVLEHMTELARGGLDFTTVGRRIVVWDSSQPIGATRTLTEADIDGDPAIYADGDGLVTIQHVVTQPEANTPPSSTENVGSHARDIAYYGPWAKIHSRADEIGDSENVQVALTTQAKNLSAGSVPVPVDIQIGSSATLRIEGGLGINDLVAGIEIPVIAKLMGRDIQRTQRLQSLTVSETGDGESIQASIGNPTSEVV